MWSLDDSTFGAMPSNTRRASSSNRGQYEHQRSIQHINSQSPQQRQGDGTSITRNPDAHSRDFEPKSTQSGSQASAMGPPLKRPREAVTSSHRYPTRSGQERREDNFDNTMDLERGKSSSEIRPDIVVANAQVQGSRRPQQGQQGGQRLERHQGAQHSNGNVTQNLHHMMRLERDAASLANEAPQTRVTTLQARNDTNQAKLVSAEKDLEKSRSQGASREMNNLKSENDDLKIGIDGLQRALKEEKLRTQQYEATIRELQAKQLKSIESTRWMPFAVSDIQRQLDSIQIQIRKWAKKYSKMSFQEFMESGDQQKMIKELVEQQCVSNEQKLLDALLNNEVIQKPGKASGLLLGATISCQVLFGIIGDPFFAFGSEYEDEHLLSSSHGSALWELINMIRKSDEAGAEGLRCQVLRLLDPPSNDTNREISEAKAYAKASRAFVAHKMAVDFIQSFAGVFDSGDRDQARSALEAIFSEAAELSWNLWTRKAKLEPDAPKRGEYEYHALHLRKLDEDPEALEGREIVVLCDAVVMMRGDADGKNFHKTRMIKKGVAWMG